MVAPILLTVLLWGLDHTIGLFRGEEHLTVLLGVQLKNGPGGLGALNARI